MTKSNKSGLSELYNRTPKVASPATLDSAILAAANAAAPEAGNSKRKTVAMSWLSLAATACIASLALVFIVPVFDTTPDYAPAIEPAPQTEQALQSDSPDRDHDKSALTGADTDAVKALVDIPAAKEAVIVSEVKQQNAAVKKSKQVATSAATSALRQTDLEEKEIAVGQSSQSVLQQFRMPAKPVSIAPLDAATSSEAVTDNKDGEQRARAPQPSLTASPATKMENLIQRVDQLIAENKTDQARKLIKDYLVNCRRCQLPDRFMNLLERADQ